MLTLAESCAATEFQCTVTVRSQDGGQVFVVDYVLPDGAYQLAGLLVQSLVVPVIMNIREFIRDQVVLAHKHGVDHGQGSVLVDSLIPWSQTGMSSDSMVSGGKGRCMQIVCMYVCMYVGR